jgi:hypothetical protein
MYGSKRKYVEVKVVDPQLFGAIKATYKPFVDQVRKGKFDLAAFTSGDTTYLLPGFFSLRDVNSQVRILIHEQIYSMTWDHAHDQPGVDLKDLLRFDIALLDVMKTMPEGQCKELPQDCGLAASKMITALQKLNLPGFEVTRQEAAAGILLLAAYTRLSHSTNLALPSMRPLEEEDLGLLAGMLGREVYDIFVGLRVYPLHLSSKYDESGNRFIEEQIRQEQLVSFLRQTDIGSPFALGLTKDPKTNLFSCLGNFSNDLTCVR